MDPRELRIGNIVRLTKNELAPIVGSYVVTVKGIKNDRLDVRFHAADSKLTVHVQHFEPIAVTEGLLKAIGFTSEGYTEGCMGYGGILNPLVLELHGSNWCWEYSDGGIGFRRALKHLHDLQNLYYVLTGIELEINITDIQ